MSRNAPAPTAAEPHDLTLTLFGLRPAETETEKSSGRHPAGAFVSTDTVWQWPPFDAAETAPRPLAAALNRRRQVQPAEPTGACADDLEQGARRRVLASPAEAAAIEALHADLAADPELAQTLAARPDWVAVSRIDPVHLQAGTDHAVVFGPRFLNLPSTDWYALVQDLNVWLAEDGLHLFTSRSGRHYLAYTAAGQERLGDQDLPSLACALNRNVQPFLSGDAVRPLRRWLTELQMWLYAHPLNAARAARGQPELNSLWLSGRASLASIRHPLLMGMADVYAPLIYTDSAVLAGALRAERGSDAVVLMAQPAPSLAELAGAWHREPGRPLHLVFTEPAWCYLEGDVAGWINALDAADGFLQELGVAAQSPLSFSVDDGRGQTWAPPRDGWRSWLRRLNPWNP
ncbi:hypothetical protein [Halothiobacillus sp.]|uniref:hypothetical protein n=1 Tax=Halothiobacillus sp. TaxID=1891311 RepID=UPI002AD2D9A7|nr:hypothetical protein [Halothiobacillus sp.]